MVSGAVGPSGGIGQTLFLNYSQTPITPQTELTGSDLPSDLVDPLVPPVPTPTPTDPTSIRGISQYLSSAPQTAVDIVIAPEVPDQVCVQFGVFLSEIGSPLFISPGIWTLNIFGHEDGAGGDVQLNFEMFAYNSADPFTGANLVPIGGESARAVVSETHPIIGSYLCNLAVPYFDLTPYDMIYLVIAAYNFNSNPHVLSLYFESPSTYGHLTTTIASGQPCFGEMYALSGTVSIPTAGPYYGMTGMTGGYSNKVSVVSSPSGTAMIPRVTDIFNIVFGVNGSSSNNATTITQSLFVNNTIVPKFTCSRYYGTSSQPGSSSVNGLLFLTDGDSVTIRFAATPAPVDFQTFNVNLTIEEMGLG